MKRNSLLIILFILSGPKYYAQKHIDTLASSDSTRDYKFHLSLTPQMGYGLILGFHGIEVQNKTYGEVYEIGISKSTSGHDALNQKYISVEINNINHKIMYGFLAGFDAKSIMEIGLSINIMSDFSVHRAIFIQPRLGIILVPFIDLFGSFEYEIPILSPNFELRNKLLFSLRYNIGFLKGK